MRAAVAWRLTTLMIPLAALASAAGLFLPGLYRETDWVVPQNRGQDLITLLLVPILGASLLAARRGSVRATMIWLGLLGYLFYTYTGASFAYTFNRLFPVYVALFSLSIFALVAGAVSLNLAAVERSFDAGVLRRPVAVFLSLLAVMLSAAYLGQILPFYTTGAVPRPIELADTPTLFVYVLDLGSSCRWR
jgi:hypothetical protein